MGKKRIFLILILVCLLVSGCGGAKYHVDYHGKEFLFKGAKDSYEAGTKVKLIYDMIATDTDYHFHVEGAEFTCEYNEDVDGFELEFVMPEHDIEVYCTSENTMVND